MHENPQKQKANLQFSGAGGRGEWRVTASEYKVSLGGDENVQELDSSGDFSQLCKNTKKHWPVHFRGWILWYVNYIFREVI